MVRGPFGYGDEDAVTAATSRGWSRDDDRSTHDSALESFVKLLPLLFQRALIPVEGTAAEAAEMMSPHARPSESPLELPGTLKLPDRRATYGTEAQNRLNCFGTHQQAVV